MGFLATKDILNLTELNKEDIYKLISFALDMKNGKDTGDILGKTVSLVFKKSSTRTRVSFEAGIYQLGGFPIYMHSGDLQLDRGETITDTGKVLSRYTDLILIRTYEHKEIEQLAAASDVPVVNGLTDLHHPCQALADLMTIYEKKEHFKGLKIAFIGDGNNVCNSLMIASKMMGMEIQVGCPKGYEPKSEILNLVDGLEGEGSYQIMNDPSQAAENADVIYTDVWVSMGEESQKNKKSRFKIFQVNDGLVSKAKKEVIVMHCLPAHRGEEITTSVIDGSNSVVFDQAENRLHAQKALILGLIGNEK